MPRKVKDVVGPLTFDNLIGALMLLHNVNIDCKFSEHCDEFAGPAVKKVIQIVKQMMNAVQML